MEERDYDDFSFIDPDRNVTVVGEYRLWRNPQGGLYEASRKDGGPVPKPLAARFTSVEDFQSAHEALFSSPSEAVSEKNLLPPKMGQYPNGAAAHDKWEQARRSAVVHQVGPYLLALDPQYRLYSVSMADGSAVPKGLVGRWLSVSDFQHQAMKLEPMGSHFAEPVITHTEPMVEAPVEKPRGNGLEDYLENRSPVGKRGAK